MSEQAGGGGILKKRRNGGGGGESSRSVGVSFAPPDSPAAPDRLPSGGVGGRGGGIGGQDDGYDSDDLYDAAAASFGDLPSGVGTSPSAARDRERADEIEDSRRRRKEQSKRRREAEMGGNSGGGDDDDDDDDDDGPDDESDDDDGDRPAPRGGRNGKGGPGGVGFRGEESDRDRDRDRNFSLITDDGDGENAGGDFEKNAGDNANCPVEPFNLDSEVGVTRSGALGFLFPTFRRKRLFLLSSLPCSSSRSPSSATAL